MSKELVKLYDYFLSTLWLSAVENLETTATICNVTITIYCSILDKSSNQLSFIGTTTNDSTNH